MELDGIWKATAANEELRRTFASLDHDDSAWPQVTVPGHWHTEDALETVDGPVMYRRHFDHRAPTAGERLWLIFDGVLYQGDVWLNGTYVGDTEGYFAPHEFDVTDLMANTNTHVLAAEITCAPPRDLTAKRNLTGVLQHWDCRDPDTNPGGIWRSVRIEKTGTTRLTETRVLCRDAYEERATIEVRSLIDTVVAGRARITTTVTHGSSVVIHTKDHVLALGDNRLAWTITVDQPELWWPWALGDQPLYDVRIEIGPAADASAAGASPDNAADNASPEPSHIVTRRIGLRRVTLRNWQLSINSETMFVKGINMGPTNNFLAAATPAQLRADVELAKSLGMDLVRVHGHITRPEVYDAADELGMLVWQDLPLQWGYARTVRPQAIRQATAAVDLLGHHPSIVLWCGHNEPLAVDIEPGKQISKKLISIMARQQQIPTWNKTVLDRSIKNALKTADPTRPVIAHSGMLPHLPQLDGTDTHLYYGWYHGEAEQLVESLRKMPRLGRFVSEFGAQALPPGDLEFIEPARWPALDWARLERHHGLQKSRFDEYVPPSEHGSLVAWQQATQQYQASLLKHHIEHLRKLKYRPTGGFAVFLLADGHEGVSWSLYGHDRSPKLAAAAVRAACAPVIVTVTVDDVIKTLTPITLPVHVISDRREPLANCRVEVTATWGADTQTWTFHGDIEPDTCQFIGDVNLTPPDHPGSLELALSVTEISSGRVIATNHYVASIVRGTH